MLVDCMFIGGLVAYKIECHDGFAGVSAVIFIVVHHTKILVI